MWFIYTMEYYAAEKNNDFMKFAGKWMELENVILSKERLKLVTVLGAGLLCGTALAVIVPEGVHALYEEVLEGKHHQASETKQNVIASDKAAEISAVHEREHSHDHTQLHAYIGVSLVLGFVFMLLVDQIGSSHVHSTEDPETARPSSSKITTTLGLVVHAAADGVALGAAASTSQTSVQLIVFVAIMLHKAPAAFGLVSFLMHAGLERNRIRKHLLVFALAAPAMSMLTYLGLSKSSKEALSEVNATGVAMLFSAGTFLYVATVHVLPEAMTIAIQEEELACDAPHVLGVLSPLPTSTCVPRVRGGLESVVERWDSV
ncbi:hypothetical protein STEG23_013136 [Scotinomys teguina]